LGELEQLVRRAQLESADCLVTTEKDWVNLPAGSEQVLRSKLFWLEIGFELEKGEEFFSTLEKRLEQASDRVRHAQHGGFVSK
jgi:tetraacyldisaccharide-1-P 4'-kinase